MDGGKTISKTISKTSMLSTPNKGNVIDENTSIRASGNNVHVTWWTNKTGMLEPLFRASNDGGNTFGPRMKLNSTRTN